MRIAADRIDDHPRHRTRHPGSWRMELAVAILGMLVGLSMAVFVLG